MSTPKQKSLFLAVIFTSLRYLSVYSFEYQIGGNENWVVPPAIDTRIYVDWALGNRFQVGDTFSFNFLGDSVMKVRVEDCKKCHSRHPNFFSNTVYYLNYPASSYFISGVSGHCEKGQRMIIIKVISTDQETNSSLQLFLLQEC
ncbi:hypothetical protein POPTR_015G113300v4 [Populus trichocarpa]|uniref:Uncharacterized protein n=1 Tax=Populus trichocarpa TaxID=3694 RepID=A0ACC0RXE2_POPTR|nr:hypothetical protein POPTR_015G113300v4 [Populus trichocarpa]